MTDEHDRSPRALGAAALLVAGLFVWSLADAQEEAGWPREFTIPDGTSVVIYQPQLDDLEGNRLSGRAALSVTLPNAESPIFGALWFESRVQTDRDSREVAFLDTQVSRVRFAEATDDQQQTPAAIEPPPLAIAPPRLSRGPTSNETLLAIRARSIARPRPVSAARQELRAFAPRVVAARVLAGARRR